MGGGQWRDGRKEVGWRGVGGGTGTSEESAGVEKVREADGGTGTGCVGER